MPPKIKPSEAFEATKRLEKGEELLESPKRSFEASRIYKFFKRNNIDDLAKFNLASDKELIKLVQDYAAANLELPHGDKLIGSSRLLTHINTLRRFSSHMPKARLSVDDFYKRLIRGGVPKSTAKKVSESYEIYLNTIIYIRERVFRTRQKLKALRKEVKEHVPQREMKEWLSDGMSNTFEWLANKWQKSSWLDVAGYTIAGGIAAYAGKSFWGWASEKTKKEGSDKPEGDGFIKRWAKRLGVAALGAVGINYATKFFSDKSALEWFYPPSKAPGSLSKRQYAKFFREAIFYKLDPRFKKEVYTSDINNAALLLTFGGHMKVKDLYRLYQQGKTDKVLKVEGLILEREINPKQAWRAANLIFNAFPDLKDKRGNQTLFDALASFIANDSRVDSLLDKEEKKYKNLSSSKKKKRPTAIPARRASRLDTIDINEYTGSIDFNNLLPGHRSAEASIRQNIATAFSIKTVDLPRLNSLVNEWLKDSKIRFKKRDLLYLLTTPSYRFTGKYVKSKKLKNYTPKTAYKEILEGADDAFRDYLIESRNKVLKLHKEIAEANYKTTLSKLSKTEKTNFIFSLYPKLGAVIERAMLGDAAAKKIIEKRLNSMKSVLGYGSMKWSDIFANKGSAMSRFHSDILAWIMKVGPELVHEKDVFPSPEGLALYYLKLKDIEGAKIAVDSSNPAKVSIKHRALGSLKNFELTFSKTGKVRLRYGTVKFGKKLDVKDGLQLSTVILEEAVKVQTDKKRFSLGHYPSSARVTRRTPYRYNGKGEIYFSNGVFPTSYFYRNSLAAVKSVSPQKKADILNSIWQANGYDKSR